MAIAEGYISNFKTLSEAFINEDVGLVECFNNETKEPVVVICAITPNHDGTVSIVPFAKMFDGDPYEEVSPPYEDNNEEA